jgi:hypothetical protein
MYGVTPGGLLVRLSDDDGIRAATTMMTSMEIAAVGHGYGAGYMASARSIAGTRENAGIRPVKENSRRADGMLRQVYEAR